MVESIPKVMSLWNVADTRGPVSLKFSEQPVPEIGDNQVLVKLKGASLNYRDLMIVNGEYPFPLKDNIVPGSDGAGIVLAIGKHVTRFSPGDKVVMTTLDGTFRTIGAFDVQGLVKMPEGLSFVEAATLTVAGTTAWNALFGGGRPLTAGQWILTQGTGGVSLFVVQFAKLVGARVISTTSSAEKADLLRKLGADHVVNYRNVPEWGAEAKKITGGLGVDFVVDVTGPSGLGQSVQSVAPDGTIVVVGAVAGLGGDAKMPTLLDTWLNLFTCRGVWVGSRMHMEDMCRAIDGNVERLRPVLDLKVFKLEELKEAYEYMAAGKHSGKVGIEIP
ncbi:zinc-binding dehydrogenase [Xylariaceae sp. FL0255]|nr:zinc-binding dehydrogenase [Xylariaceae sp. FL0255]